jgi:hypothetical protein
MPPVIGKIQEPVVQDIQTEQNAGPGKQLSQLPAGKTLFMIYLPP